MPLLLVGAIPETNEVEINLWGGDAPALILDGTDTNMNFIIESCSLQILDAYVIVTPTLSLLQRFISRFPFLFIVCLATFLQAITILTLSLIGLYFLKIKGNTQLFPVKAEKTQIDLPKKKVEDLKPDSDRENDSWSECHDSD